MSALQIFLFGHVRLTHAVDPRPLKVTGVVQLLLTYLLIQRQRNHSREVLIDLFWGDYPEKQARNCLNTTLWRLRAILEPEGVPRGTYLVTTAAREVGFNHESDYWLDLAIFEDRLDSFLKLPINAMDADQAKSLEETIQLYSGELLDACYEDWALRERERFRSLYLSGLAHLMRCYRRQGNYERSLQCGHKILELDPLREEIHGELMQIYVENGQRAMAVRQYEACRQVLLAELGIPPMPETHILYSQIAGHAAEPTIPMQASESGLQQALHYLHRSVKEFECAHKQLQRAIELMETYTKR